jgi:hypothetical protein
MRTIVRTPHRSGKDKASFFREKKKQKKLPHFGSVWPQPAKPPTPPYGFAERGVMGFAGCGSTEPNE